MTEKQWRWLSDFANTIILLGFAYVFVRLTGGRSYQPTFHMPLLVRIVLLTIGAVLATTFRTWWYFHRKRRRRSG